GPRCVPRRRSGAWTVRAWRVAGAARGRRAVAGPAAAQRHGLGARRRNAPGAGDAPVRRRSRRRADVRQLQCRDRREPRRRPRIGGLAAPRRPPPAPGQARRRQPGDRTGLLIQPAQVAVQGPAPVICGVWRRVVRARGMWMDVLARIGFGLFGLAVLVGIAWLFSSHKRQVDWRLVATGIALQVGFAALVLLVPGGRDVFDALGDGFVRLLGFVNVGSEFIFGSLMNVETYGFVFAFQVLQTIIVFAPLMGVLYRLEEMQTVMRAVAWAITKVLGQSGADTSSVGAREFIGQTEAPLTVRPYIAKMTESELMTMMVGGMAHIAGGVLAAYVGMLGGGDTVAQAFYAKHLLAASIMAAPATMVVAKLLIPETSVPLTRGTVKMEVEKTTSNVIDAAAAGAADGLKLALNIGAMLLAFIALIALINWPLTWLGEVTGLAALLGKPTDMASLMCYVLSPIAWLIG